MMAAKDANIVQKFVFLSGSNESYRREKIGKRLISPQPFLKTGYKQYKQCTNSGLSQHGSLGSSRASGGWLLFTLSTVWLLEKFFSLFSDSSL